jgi:hypothetical protein
LGVDEALKLIPVAHLGSVEQVSQAHRRFGGNHRLALSDPSNRMTQS